MSEFDSDIEFDFFEDLETREEPRPQERKAGRPPGGPRRPGVLAWPGLTPTLRLVGLIAFAILVIVLLVFWVQSCQSGGKKKSYSTLHGEGDDDREELRAIGRQLTNALVTPASSRTSSRRRSTGSRSSSSRAWRSAEQLSLRCAARTRTRACSESLGFRVDGLRGLADTFRRTAGSKKVASASPSLSTQAQRLVTSDVVYRDLFRHAGDRRDAQPRASPGSRAELGVRRRSRPSTVRTTGRRSSIG